MGNFGEDVSSVARVWRDAADSEQPSLRKAGPNAGLRTTIIYARQPSGFRETARFGDKPDEGATVRVASMTINRASTATVRVRATTVPAANSAMAARYDEERPRRQFGDKPVTITTARTPSVRR